MSAGFDEDYLTWKTKGPYLHGDKTRRCIYVQNPITKKWHGVKYARYLLSLHLGYVISTDLIVHHINEDKLDDRIENLQLMTQSEHCVIHNKERKGEVRSNRKFDRIYQVKCYGCGKEFTLTYEQNSYRASNGCVGPFCTPKCRGDYAWSQKKLKREENVNKSV